MLSGAAAQIEQTVRIANLTAWRTVHLTPPEDSAETVDPPEREAGRKKPQTVEQQAAVVRGLHALFGGKLIVGDPQDEARA